MVYWVLGFFSMYDFSMNPALNLSAFLFSEKLCLTGEQRLRGRVGGQSSDSELSFPLPLSASAVPDRQVYQTGYIPHCKEIWIYLFPEKGLRAASQTQFPHACVCERSRPANRTEFTGKGIN
jgi:hypothetical protein